MRPIVVRRDRRAASSRRSATLGWACLALGLLGCERPNPHYEGASPADEPPDAAALPSARDARADEPVLQRPGDAGVGSPDVGVGGGPRVDEMTDGPGLGPSGHDALGVAPPPPDGAAADTRGATADTALPAAPDAVPADVAGLGPAPDASADGPPAPRPLGLPAEAQAGGLRGDYFDELDFRSFKLARVDSMVDFKWEYGVPHSSMGADTFSVRWTGWLVPRYSEVYTIRVLSDDGSRVWVGGRLVVDFWHDHTPQEASGTIALEAGRAYEIKVEYYENKEYSVITLRWQSARQSVEVIPASRLYHRP
jgi:hypothetical protein